MRRAIYEFVFSWRYAPLTTALGLITLMLCLIFLAGAHRTEIIPYYFGSQREYIGMILLILIMPSYMATSAIWSIRRTADLAAQLDKQYATDLTGSITKLPTGILLISAALGLAYAVLFNIPGSGVQFFTAPSSEKLTIFGQSLIWILVASFICLRVHASNQFRRAGARVPIDIFEASHLRPFARVGLIDALVMAGGLVLSTVQSLDFSFRPDNYSKALIVTLPALAFLMINPMWLIHHRMAALKDGELRELNEAIARTSKRLTTQDMQSLEILLQRRERTARLSTWPIDVSVLQRFLFYIIIPPLAWVGAALVESLVNSAIAP